jgi:general secretion pathway protein B
MQLFRGSIIKERVEVSFILDAIAKSEHDRQQQEVPDARTLALPVGSEPRPRRVLPFLVVVALLLNVIVLVIWMQSDRSLLNLFSLSQSDAIEQSTEQAFVSDNSSTTNQIISVDAVATVASSKSTEEIENSASTLTAVNTSSPKFIAQTEKMVSTSKTLIEPKGETISEPPDTESDLEGESKLTPPQHVAETTSLEETVRVRNEPDTLSNKIHPGGLANQSPGGQDAGEVRPRKVSRLSELPADVRRDFPSVNFSGHLYSSNPKLSYVFVNDGRSVFEGQQIVDELSLHEITPTGVIVEFRGYLIDVGVLQNWNLN